MNKYFINIAKNLNLKVQVIKTTDDIQSLTKNYENHISIKKIKETYPKIVPGSSHFKSVSLDVVTEAATGCVLSKKVFLEISKKLQASGLELY